MQNIDTTQELTQQITQQLWRCNSDNKVPIVYAILDGARNSKIHKMVNESELRSSCLYEGRLSYDLTIAAPYIIRLEKDIPFTNDLIKQAWGKSWGIFAQTFAPTTMIAVRRNCRKLAFVKDEENRKLLFRYYDPRVLRDFIPTCTADALKQVFGPTTRYLMENEDATALHSFELQTDIGELEANIFPLTSLNKIENTGNI